MNRIYQGKVTAVEIPDGKDEQGKATNWLSAIEHWLFARGAAAGAAQAVNF